MAIQIDSITTGSGGATSSNTLTWSHTVSGTNRLLVVTVGMSRDRVVNSVTYNNVALTQAVAADNGSTEAYIGYLIAPDIGTYNIVVTYSNAQTYNVAGAASFTGVKQTSCLGATNTKVGTAQNKSIDITTQSNNSVIIDCIGAMGGVHTPTAGQTVILNSDNRISSYEIVGTAGLYTQTWDSTIDAGYAMCVAEFKEASVFPNFFPFF